MTQKNIGEEISYRAKQQLIKKSMQTFNFFYDKILRIVIFWFAKIIKII